MEKILVVDHELSTLHSYNTVLSSAGYGVINAVDGKKGFEKYKKEKPDLVLMDVMIPGMEWHETARLMRQDSNTPHMPIIFVFDALNKIEKNFHALDSRDTDFLVKPVEDKALLLKIRASLRMKKLNEELLSTRKMLRKSEAKYSTIIKTLQDGYFEIDKNGTITFFNNATSKIFGYPGEKLMGMNILMLTAPESVGIVKKNFIDFQQIWKPTNLVEYKIARGDGSIRLVEVSASLVRDENSDPAGFHGIIKDVTEKRKAERENLIKSFAVEKSINAIAIMDIFGNCTFANNSFVMMWGYDEMNAVLSKSIIDICHPDNRDDFMNILEVLKEIGSWGGELMLKKKDNSTFFVILSAAIIKSEMEEPMGIIMSFVDITLRKKVDYSLKESKDVLTKRNMQMENDLQIAQTALGDIIAKDVPSLESLKIDYRYLPMEKLGGDYFCFYPYNKDTLGVFICDVSGHGIGSSLFVALLKSITDKLSMKFGESPADFITQLNLELMGHMSSFYITGIYGLFTHPLESEEILFSYANGAHPGPILVKNNGQIQLHAAKSTLIGINSDIVYNTNTIKMGKGDRLFLYTDGIPETSNPKHAMIGFEDTLLEFFRKSHQLTLGENLDNIISQVSRFRSSAKITDDMLILGVEAIG